MKREQEEEKKAQPVDIPRQTYWPFILAVGVTFFGWGMIAGWILSVAGLLIFFIALAGWINELIHERRTEIEEPA